MGTRLGWWSAAARWAAAVAVGAAAFAGVSGAAPPTATEDRATEDQATAAAVRALADPGRHDVVPAGFDAETGYAPVVLGRGAAAGLARPDGSCSSPWGGTSHGFTTACRQHDLGYDLLRYADGTGHPLGPWARELVDDLFAERLHDRCDSPRCHAVASVYATAVEVNTVRQSGGVPHVETAGRWALSGVAAVAAAALLLAVTGRTPTGGRRVTLVATGVAGLAFAASLTPTVLPRSPLVQAVLSGVVAAQAWGLAAAVAWTLGRVRPTRPAPPPGPRAAVLGLGAAAAVAGLVAVTAVVGFRGQQRLATAVEVAAPTPVGQVAAVLGGAALAAALVGAGWAVRAAIRAVVRGRPRRLPRPRRRPAAALAVAVLVAGTGLTGAGLAPAAADDRRGRDFLALATPADRIESLTGRPATDPVRVYVGVDDAPSPTARARLAVDRLQRSGALDRDVLLVVVPTGTGWVNPAAPAALELLHGGDTATLAVQYATASSYATYVSGTAAATRSALAVTDAVEAAVRARAASGRPVPRVVLYGESLGAIAGLQAVDAGAADVDASLWVGVPGQARALLRPGHTALLHPEDPVAAWSPDLLWRPTATWPDDWWPLVSFWQSTADLLGARGTPSGYGHRYGGELVDAFATVAPPDDRLDDPADDPADDAARDRVRAEVVAVAVAHP